jgi:hypothetical protein
VNYIIVGTDHELQKVDNGDEGLKDLLLSVLAAHPVVLIAEEVKTSEKVHTFGRELIGKSKWLSIDMTAKQRKKAGINALPLESGPGYDPVTHRDIVVNRYHTKKEDIRETFWLDRIAEWCKDHKVSVGTVVLVCGHNHMRAGFLSHKVLQRGHSITTLEYVPHDIEARHGVFRICP